MIEIPVLFEDNDICVINKPVGMMVHEDGQAEGETVVDWFLHHCPAAKGVGEPGRSPQGKDLERSGVVHRLDRETSGVLVLAKHQDAFVHLKTQFHDRLARKEYRAFVYGPMREPWGTIDRPIGRSGKDFRQRSAERGAKGTLREAVTAWECIGTGRYLDEHFSYLKLIPKTGRTHQIRVHLKAIGKPIVQDKLYASHVVAGSNNLDFDRMALHAYQLELTLPSLEVQRFLAPMPIEFEAAAEKIADE